MTKKGISMLLVSVLVVDIIASLVSCGDSTEESKKTIEASESEVIETTIFEDKIETTDNLETDFISEPTTSIDEEKEVKTISSPSEIGIGSDEMGGVIIPNYFAENIGISSIDVDENELQNYAETCGEAMFNEATSDSLGKVTFVVNSTPYFALYTWYCDMDYSNLAYLKMVGYDGSEDDAWDSLRELMIQYSILEDRFLNLEYEDYHSVITLQNEQDVSLTLMASCNGEIIYDVTEDKNIKMSDNAKAKDVLDYIDD